MMVCYTCVYSYLYPGAVVGAATIIVGLVGVILAIGVIYEFKVSLIKLLLH